ncbi:pseudouridine synthase [Anabaena sp. FACHB-709]|uniref:RNA pseudouridylate synthase n=2 Tax=Nostocaceae TaxID=1162 RepID=A0A1Z4KL59_ANAVA|nr:MULTISPECIES: RluA family pseudouridine synthase [Nostocaceae]BAY69706.1 ribosomal large chain pseudouridine synthase A [Trichormus variabilis NIES-23]HBW32440.1 RluA family pseudouridine synthase [Nostoc sp. UBA8866]MBD2173640.1 RluA family pseudouridine synthase [Anabaena cylindrica FACHB-318]MBD2265481.1 RluA family pseudouridine synthase [Anabaena sp. FACHB-709]MBD2274595.1 RluA family pseudouridine synthase [Nostoc sp. PCC 7120 = FACHB-418]
MPFTEVLHPLSDFIEYDLTDDDLSGNYWYEGYCLQYGDLLRLPRTALVEAIAHSLMQCLAKDERYCREGKMYGILLVELPTGERRVLKAFSGLLNGQSVFDGWVPPIPGREQVAIQEGHTLAELDAIKQELTTLKQLPERQEYETIFREFEQQLQAMSDRHRYRKHQRQQTRQLLSESLLPAALTIALEQLNEESRQDGIERRRLKQERDTALQALKEAIASANIKIQNLKQKRKALSQQLQSQMHAAYSLMNFLGQSVSLQQLMPNGLPTGTGDCCAPKLLHYAATHGLKPLAMGEFWWGSSCQDKIQGEFYGACVERCQPLMGFLLSGLKPTRNLEKEQINVIYEDEWLIAVNKPSGLLSVPGRYIDTQDSVLSRLRHMLPEEEMLAAVHRLDQDTSGILLLARDSQTYRQFSQQFQQRQVYKVYEAILAGVINTDTGIIDLPLWGDPENRPYQQVDWQRGKPSVTNFREIAREGDYTRVEFVPLTGRTHQLRVHASDVQGLGVVILGDRFYGCTAKANRLHLHARELSFLHPRSGKTIHLHIKTPF